MPLPEKAYQLSTLVLHLLSKTTVDELDQISGTEHLLWLHDWSIWDNHTLPIGVGQFDHLRLGYGLTASIDQEPAMVFEGTEMGPLISFALIPLVFGWDFYIIPTSGNYFVFGCHHDWIGFSARNEAVESTLALTLPQWAGLSLRRSNDYCLAGLGET